MDNDKLNKIADDLVELAGGYNPKGFIIIGLGGVAVGFFVGGLFGMLIGLFYLMVLILGCLASIGVIAYVKTRQSDGPSNMDWQQPAAQDGDSESPSWQTLPTPEAAPPLPSPAPVELSEFESRIMERVDQTEGALSVSALASELGVSGDEVRQTIEDLANRGIISLG